MENNSIFVLLAGGKSSRMGIDKGLLKFKDHYWVLEQLNRISKSNISEVYIGLGYHFKEYFNAISWFENAQNEYIIYKKIKVKVLVNSNPELGSFSTLQTVLKNVPPKLNVIINPIDTPILNFEELNLIASTNNSVVFPNYKGKNGHPIKISPTIWNNFLVLKSTDLNFRLDFQLKKINPVKISTIEVSDRAILYNLNKKSEWNSYLNSIK